MFIPEDLMITFEKTLETPMGKILEEKGYTRPDGRLMAVKGTLFSLFLLQEKLKPIEERSFQPYLDSLPTNIDNFPAFFTDQELKYLEGS